MDTEKTVHHHHNNNTSEDIDGVPNDASGVSDSRETRPQQELFAIGGETEGQPPSNTLVADSSKPEEAPSAQQSSHLPEGNNWETCNCTKRTHMAYVNGVECLICGKVNNLVVHESAPATSTSESETALSQTLVTGMVMVPHTPEPSPEDQSATSCEPVDQRALCGAGLDGSRIPIEGNSETSVQIPCTPFRLTLFILRQCYQQTNEQKFSIHFAEDLQQTRIPSWIKQMESQGIKLVSFGDEHLSQQQNQYFHSLCLKNGITVKFGLVKQIHQKFMIRVGPSTHEIPLHRIKSLCQHRIPGPTLQVTIESLCEPGEVCQDHLRMTMECGQVVRKWLIPIWSSGQM